MWNSRCSLAVCFCHIGHLNCTRCFFFFLFATECCSHHLLSSIQVVRRHRPPLTSSSPSSLWVLLGTGSSCQRGRWGTTRRQQQQQRHCSNLCLSVSEGVQIFFRNTWHEGNCLAPLLYDLPPSELPCFLWLLFFYVHCVNNWYKEGIFFSSTLSAALSGHGQTP